MPAERQTVRYDGFAPYEESGLPALVQDILRKSTQRAAGVVVTASILTATSYGPVLDTLNTLSEIKEHDSKALGRIFLVACENSLDAHEVFAHPEMSPRITAATRRHVTCVQALVDRICVALEEEPSPPHPAVQVRAEEYGSLKLKHDADTEALVDLCQGTAIEFSRHLEIEKQIKSWLVNGTHSLLALTAFQDGQGDGDLKLNDYLNAVPENRRFAEAALEEMSTGIATLLRDDPHYASFVAEVDVERYLEGARKVLLNRFASTADPIARILARFRAPAPGDFSNLEAFIQRFADRVNAPITAYERANGFAPPTASRGIVSLFRLIASRQFVNPAPQ